MVNVYLSKDFYLVTHFSYPKPNNNASNTVLWELKTCVDERLSNHLGKNVATELWNILKSKENSLD